MAIMKEILEKAKWGDISNNEKKLVVEELKNINSDNLYTAVHIAGKAEMFDCEQYVANLLECKNNPMVSALSLRVLCSYWGKTETYLGFVKKFVLGVEWDVDDDVRIAAIGLSGEYLKTQKDIELYKALKEIFLDEEEFNAVRSAAYSAIGRSFGYEYKDLPPANRFMDFNSDVDVTLIDKLEKTIKQLTEN
jgi:hypothetical protein